MRGVVIEESLLVGEDECGNYYLPPKSSTLLRRLKYSKLRVGICYHDGVLPEKAAFLAGTTASYSHDCISLHASNVRDSLNQLSIAWNCVGETCCYVTSQKDDDLFSGLDNIGWKTICICADPDVALNKDALFINKLEELLISICSFSKMAMDNAAVLTIGYVMKPSREEDFAKRGAYPMYPTENGLVFVPLDFDLSLASQMQQVDVILHKATDEITNIELSSSLDFSKRISFSRGIQELERYVQSHPDLYMIDQLSNIYPLVDRHQIQQILLELEEFDINCRKTLRAPHFLQVDNFSNPKLREQLAEAKLELPVIVKPQVACGVSDAHNMALVFKFEDFEGLGIPLPAIVQEYVDHGSLLFKFYVLGRKVFHAVKKSMPNSSYLCSMAEKSGSGAVLFNSLKSLPVAKEDDSSGSGIKADKQILDVELVNGAARWLKQRLGLTIFGFDVVVQEGTGDHVIVDLNYLPSFKEVPDCDAIPAFWEAIKSSYEFMKEKTLREASTAGT